MRWEVGEKGCNDFQVFVLRGWTCLHETSHLWTAPVSSPDLEKQCTKDTGSFL